MAAIIVGRLGRRFAGPAVTVCTWGRYTTDPARAEAREPGCLNQRCPGTGVAEARAAQAWWQVQDRKVLRRINALIADIERNDNDGIGKPEPLKHGFQGYWSRRITTDEHRLVYKIAGDEIRIAACRYHYER